MKRRLLVVYSMFAAVNVWALPLHGQGSSVYTHSACMTALAGAGVASPCADGSAVFYNPAALAMQRSVAGVALTPITTGGSFTYDTGETVDRPSATTLVPAGFAAYRVSDRWAVGVGAWAPYGLGIEWPIEFEGRFVGYDNSLQGLYIQPTSSYALTPWLSLGAGVDIVLGSIEINQRLDLATTGVPGTPFTFGNLGIPLGTDFADAALEGDGTAVTFHLGLLAELTDRLSFGARYLHFADVEFDGTARFDPVATGLIVPQGNPLDVPGGTPLDVLLDPLFASGGTLSEQAVTTRLEFPNQAVIGFAYRPIDRLMLLADYQFTGWQSFDVAPIDFENAPDQPLILDYQDAYTYRLGAEFGATDALALRGGFIYNTAAEKDASVSPLLPEAERNYYTAGIGYRIFDGLVADLGFQYIVQADRRGRVRGRMSTAQTAEELNVGLYTSDAYVLSGTLSYRFGPIW